MTKYILALDIGGTNPRLAMMEVLGPDSYEIKHKQSIDKNQDSVIPSINNFLKECADRFNYTTDTCCACVAGPISNNECLRPTNAKFPVSGDEIAEKTELKNVLVINDFQAIGEAVATFNLSKRNEALVPLTPALNPDPFGNRGVIGPGTGLGVSYLIYTRKGFIVSPSEGGHAGSPIRGDYSALYRFIQGKYNIRQVGMEALVSGQGIRNILEFLLSDQELFQELIRKNPSFGEEPQDKRVTDETFKESLRKEADGAQDIDTARLVSESIGYNQKAKIAMRLFMEFLGSAAQSVALHGLTTGGLFIAGGIPEKNLELLRNGDFMSSFLDNWKPNIALFLQKIPVYVISDYDINFYGCARAANQQFHTSTF